MYILAIITALVLTIVIMITSISSVYASTNDTDDINKPLYRQIQELIQILHQIIAASLMRINYIVYQEKTKNVLKVLEVMKMEFALLKPS